MAEPTQKRNVRSQALGEIGIEKLFESLIGTDALAVRALTENLVRTGVYPPAYSVIANFENDRVVSIALLPLVK
jgi:hypothetical protein